MFLKNKNIALNWKFVILLMSSSNFQAMVFRRNEEPSSLSLASVMNVKRFMGDTPYLFLLVQCVKLPLAKCVQYGFGPQICSYWFSVSLPLAKCVQYGFGPQICSYWFSVCHCHWRNVFSMVLDHKFVLTGSVCVIATGEMCSVWFWTTNLFLLVQCVSLPLAKCVQYGFGPQICSYWFSVCHCHWRNVFSMVLDHKFVLTGSVCVIATGEMCSVWFWTTNLFLLVQCVSLPLAKCVQYGFGPQICSYWFGVCHCHWRNVFSMVVVHICSYWFSVCHCHWRNVFSMVFENRGCSSHCIVEGNCYIKGTYIEYVRTKKDVWFISLALSTVQLIIVHRKEVSTPSETVTSLT